MLIAAMYQAIGVGIALITKQFFWVPHRFRCVKGTSIQRLVNSQISLRWGIFVVGGWGNYGDICEFYSTHGLKLYLPRGFSHPDCDKYHGGSTVQGSR
jgi:hypothetical protein